PYDILGFNKRLDQLNKFSTEMIDLSIEIGSAANLRDRLEIPEERFYIDVEETGNTVSPTIPIALRNALDKGQVREGSKVLIAGFGVGYSWGATVLRL
ncbi:MAG: hypothetical protein EOM17_14375, partial [Synergistales bacterium]|nr:hypothetical protein [Synergistales bacterium]